MGMPLRWTETEFAAAATESFRLWLRLHSEALRRVLG